MNSEKIEMIYFSILEKYKKKQFVVKNKKTIKQYFKLEDFLSIFQSTRDQIIELECCVSPNFHRSFQINSAFDQRKSDNHSCFHCRGSYKTLKEYAEWHELIIRLMLEVFQSCCRSREKSCFQMPNLFQLKTILVFIISLDLQTLEKKNLISDDLRFYLNILKTRFSLFFVNFFDNFHYFYQFYAWIDNVYKENSDFYFFERFSFNNETNINDYLKHIFVFFLNDSVKFNLVRLLYKKTYFIKANFPLLII